MPSASGKLEKQMSTETYDPMKQVVTIVEKKVRNLEKRKGKLDSYRQDSQNGKELNEDQKKAVEKYDQVLELLDFAKELQKQFNTVIQECSKSQKKAAKREQLERQQQELQRVKEIMVYQDLLNSMGGDDVRQDFLNGNKGAVKLSEADLNSLDELYKAICPERDSDSFEVVADAESTSDFDALLSVAAEHVQALLDAKNKEAFGTTYKNLKDTLQKIHSCCYFSKPSADLPNVSESNESPEEKIIPTEDQISSEHEMQYAQPETNISPEVEDFVMVQKGAPQVERPSYYPVESSSLYSEQPQPIPEVLSVQSNINFLQESQIESARVEPQSSTHGVSYANVPYPPAAQSIAAMAPQHRIRRTSEESPSIPPPHAAMGTIPTSQPSDFDPAVPIPTQTYTNQSFSTNIHHPMMAQAYVPHVLAASNIAMATGHSSVSGLATGASALSQQANIYSLCLQMNQLNTEASQPSHAPPSQYDLSEMQDSSVPSSTFGNGGESLVDNRSRAANNAYSRAPTQLDYGSDRAYQITNNSQLYMNRDNFGDNSSYSSNLKRGLTSRGGVARGTGAPRGTSNARGGSRVGYRN